MSTGALQHLLLRLRRWWLLHNLRSRARTRAMLSDNVEADLAQDALLLVDLRAEQRMVNAQLRAIEQGMAAAHRRTTSAQA